MYKNLKLRNKILIPTCIVVAIALSILAGFMTYWMGQTAVKDARILAEEISERYAVEVENFISPIMEQARAVAGMYEGALQSGETPDRNYYNGLLRTILERDPAFLGIWTVWAENAFDGQDELFADVDQNHDSSGRYVPYVFRTETGIDSRACSKYDEQTYYTVPMSTGKDFVTEPYTWEADGKIVMGIDSAIPIFHNGKPVGSTGIDYNVTAFVEMVKGITPFETGQAYIVAHNGRFVGHPDPEMVNMSMDDAFGPEVGSKLAKAMAAGEELELDLENESGEIFRLFVPIDVTGAGQYWGFGVDIPMEKVLAEAKTMVYRSIVIGVVVLLVLALFLYFLARSIAKPITKGAELAQTIGKGILSERLDYDSKDETGQLATALNNMADGLEGKAELAGRIAQGDLTGDIEAASSQDVLGNALIQMTENLNTMVGGVRQTSMEVDSAAAQVSAASDALSQGATEQAASLEEITSSLTEIGSQTRDNAENASKANNVVNGAHDRANESRKSMDRMVDAMQEVSTSSEAIAKIIKVIDEIAFQTNLLALNAAVEAARAGKHGKGFAVVADEVRNLAGRSAKAAQETAELIDGAVSNVRNTNEMVGLTAESLQGVINDVAEVAELVSDIASASSEQSRAIGEISEGLQQVDTVTQRNTANAEETSSAAQELSSQASELKTMLAKFQVRNQATRAWALPSGGDPEPDYNEFATDNNSSDFGAPASGNRFAQVPKMKAPDAGVSPEEVISLNDDEFGRF